MRTAEEIIAQTLNIRIDLVNDDLHFQSVPEWDSLSHVNLILALEADFGVQIDADQMIALDNVHAIREFVAGHRSS